MSQEFRESPEQDRTEEFPLLGVMEFILQRWKWFGIAAVVGGGLFFGLSFLMTPIYVSHTRVVPSALIAGGRGFGQAASILNYMSSIDIPISMAGNDPSSLIPEILRSDDFARQILGKRFASSSGDSVPLIDVVLPPHKTDNEEKRLAHAIRILSGNILSSSFDAKSGVTTIKAQLPDPNIAAHLANRCVRQLDAFNLKMRVSQAGHEVRFISQRLQDVQEQLEDAERLITAFKEENRSIANSPQLQLEEIRMQRDVQIAQELYLTLKTQLEVAKIQELKSVPSLRVVEHARAAMEPTSPRRGLMAVAGMVLGVGMLFVYFAVRSVYAIRKRTG